MSSYAIISLGGKQYRVSEGERLLVGGNGEPDLAPSTTVTARVVGHELGKKIRIGKYKRRTGYKKHGGHRSRLTRIEIESIGGKAKAAPKAEKAEPKAQKAERKAEKAEAKPAAKAEAAATGIDISAMTIADITTA